MGSLGASTRASSALVLLVALLASMPWAQLQAQPSQAAVPLQRPPKGTAPAEHPQRPSATRCELADPKRARTLSVYLRNRSVGHARLVAGEPCLPAATLASVVGGSLRVLSSGELALGSRRLAVRASRIDGQWFVPLQKLAPLLGYCYRYDMVLGIIDLYRQSVAPDVVRAVNARLPGEELDVRPLLVAGRETLLYFASDRSEACQQIDISLQRLLAIRPGLVVRRLDVCRAEVEGIDWTSLLMTRWGIRSLPWFVLFDAQGNQLLQGDEAYRQVVAWVKAGPQPSKEPRAR